MMRRAVVAVAMAAVLVGLCGCGESFWRGLARNSANPTGDLSKIGYAHGETPPQSKTVQMGSAGVAPAPKLKRVPRKIVKGKQMPETYITTNTPGTAGYGGAWVASGEYGGKTAYTNGTNWLWWHSVLMMWVMSPNKGDAEGALKYVSTVADLPADPFSSGMGGGIAPAPVLAEQLAEIRFGSSEANAALWNDASTHRYSKFGPVGGYRNTDSGVTGEVVPCSIQVNWPGEGAGTATATVKLGGHTVGTVTGIGHTETWDTHAFDAGLPYSETGADDWAGWLGAAGAKELSVELRADSDGALLAQDTFGYTMFVPALEVDGGGAGLPDVFDVDVNYDEFYQPVSYAHLVEMAAVVSGTEYEIGGASASLLAMTPVTVRCDLVTCGYTGGEGIPEGAFVLRAKSPFSQIADTDVASSHTQTYQVSLLTPADGAELSPGTTGTYVGLLQGWARASRISTYTQEAGVWSWRSAVEIAAYAGNRYLAGGSFVAAVGITGLKVIWEELSGTDWIELANDAIAVTVSADGGGGDGGGGGGGGGETTPWVNMDLPADGAEVAEEFTAYLSYGNFAATAAGNLKIVAVGATDTVTLHDAAQALAPAGTIIVALDFGAVAEGAYTLYITLDGEAGEQALDTAALTLETGHVPADPPVVEIVTPAAAATISGRASEVTVSATTEGAIWRVALLVDGVLSAAGYAYEAGADGLYHFALDTRPFLNGEHVLTAIARDSDLQAGESDPVTITVANSLADLTRYLYSLPLGVDESGAVLNTASARWLNRDKRRFIEVPILPDVSALEPQEIYNLSFGYDDGQADPPVWADFTLYDPMRSRPVPATKRVRYGMCVRPTQVVANWEVAADSIVRMALDEDENVLLLCDGPAQVLRYVASTGAVAAYVDLAEVADSPVDIVACLGSVYVAHGNRVLEVDLDTGDLVDDLDLDFRTAKDAVTALATDGDALFAAVTLTAGGSLIYRYTPDGTQLWASHDHEITALQVIGGVLYAGNDHGDVLRVTSSGATLVYATGQSISRFGSNADVIYAGTQTSGKLFSSLAAWSEVFDSGFTAFTGIAVFDGYTLVGGTGTGARYLWREASRTSFAQAFDLGSDVTAVSDMLAIGEKLLVAATVGAASRLCRVEVAPASSYQCGVNVISFCGKALR